MQLSLFLEENSVTRACSSTGEFKPFSTL